MVPRQRVLPMALDQCHGIKTDSGATLVYCKICEAVTTDFGKLKILSSFDARYRRCTKCGFIFVDDPNWLHEAYSSAIAAADTGIVARNLKLAEIVSLLVELRFRSARRFLDFGGGAGLLVRLMRDAGFDFFLLDKYCQNILAGGFEAEPDETFDLVTCMEVAEHLVDPITTFLELATLAPTIVISTELVPESGNKPGEWSYYSPETGQHVSFYTVAALHIIAERVNLRLATNGVNLHLLSNTSVTDWVLRLLSSRKGRLIARMIVRLMRPRRRSLIGRDADKVRTSRSTFYTGGGTGRIILRTPGQVDR